MGSERLSDLEEDIRATADDIASDAARIIEAEEEKVELPADDPRRAALAREVETLTAGQAAKARVESGLVDQAAAAAKGDARSD